MTDTSIREQRDLHVISDNHSLFSVYRSHLIPDLWKTTSGRSTLSILTKLEQYLGENEPTEQLARSFLLQYSTKKPSTQRLYSRVVEKFMNWYIQLPENTPRLHTQHSPKHAVSLLLQAIRAKKTHKSTIERDSLLVELALETGLTRGELANLKFEDVKANYVVIESPKLHLCRMIPLSETLAERLRAFSKNQKANSNIFKLKPPCLSGKINRLAKKANLTFRLGELRHEYAIELIARDISASNIQQLLGHKEINSTKVYFSCPLAE